MRASEAGEFTEGKKAENRAPRVGRGFKKGFPEK
jgi:hypothetical protein